MFALLYLNLGLALIPCLVMGIALTPYLMMGLALYPYEEAGFLFVYHSGDLCCTYECHDVDGVLSYTAVLVAVDLSPYHQ